MILSYYPTHATLQFLLKLTPLFNKFTHDALQNKHTPIKTKQREKKNENVQTSLGPYPSYRFRYHQLVIQPQTSCRPHGQTEPHLNTGEESKIKE